MDNERLRSTAEAAEWLGVTVGTFQRWAKEGTVTPTVQLPGGGYRWSLTDLREQLKPRGDDVPDSPNRPAVVTAIVTSERGVLLGNRHDGKPPWTFIAGEQEPGESPADTAVREVKEETGLDVVVGEVLGERDHPATHRHMIYMVARPARSGDLDVIVGDTDELADVRWVPLEEADELLPGMFEPVKEHLVRVIGSV